MSYLYLNINWMGWRRTVAASLMNRNKIKWIFKKIIMMRVKSVPRRHQYYLELSNPKLTSLEKVYSYWQHLSAWISISKFQAMLWISGRHKTIRRRCQACLIKSKSNRYLSLRKAFRNWKIVGIVWQHWMLEWEIRRNKDKWSIWLDLWLAIW